MEKALILFIIVLGNCALYWFFIGQKKQQQQMFEGRIEEIKREGEKWQKNT
ncbi:TPA: hypothetical protein HA278_07240 [Candidatus Woesearchaeota archaeon]|nr:hypothetical protein [Candidatus Woesearchaeota archaeon]|tara:strand:+ start:330 stop:482 length:153 start_codon:yes stop_codon:yes gene_type:complete